MIIDFRTGDGKVHTACFTDFEKAGLKIVDIVKHGGFIVEVIEAK